MTKWTDDRVPAVHDEGLVICRECGFGAGQLQITDLVIALRTLVGEWRSLFEGSNFAALAQVHTAVSAWSAIERAVQVRDVLHEKADRLQRLRDQHATILDEPWPGSFEADPDLDTARLVAAMAADTERLAALTWALPRLSRARRSKRGAMAARAECLLEEAVHRTAHNLHDARRVLGTAALGGQARP